MTLARCVVQYRQLGDTGLCVSRFCFGTLPMGPLQANLPPAQGEALLRLARHLGVTFFDTADSYQTYPLLKAALAGDEGAIIATKGYAYNEEGARQLLERARQGLGRDVIDVMLLHEHESELTLQGHREALDYLYEEKLKGTIRAVGVSTHSLEVVERGVHWPQLEVIHPLLNRQGLGIQGGSRQDMEKAIEAARAQGRGIYAMKALGGGHFYEDARAALAYAGGLRAVDAVAVGVKNEAELRVDIAWLLGQEAEPHLVKDLQATPRQLFIEWWCQACGRCVERCPFGALELGEETVRVNPERCLLCGYCAGACPHFCIKVV